jgi:hypothetical protein
MYTKDVLYFGSTVNELMVGVDALRPFYAAAPRDLKIKPGELTAVQVAPNVLLCSGYQVLTSSNNESVLRLSFVLVNNNGTWLTAQAHFSRLPR